MSSPVVHQVLATDLEASDPPRLVTLSPTVVGASAVGDAPHQRPKKTPSEDSLALVERGGLEAAIVADAHFGPEASMVIARVFVELIHSRGAELPSFEGLRMLAERLLDRVPDELSEGARSESTLLAFVRRGRSCAWLSIGDSHLLSLPAGRPAPIVLTTPTSAYVGARTGYAARDAAQLGTLVMKPGDLILLATDGLDEGACGLDLSQIGAHLREEASLEARVQRLVERASSHALGGGGDNLALVAFA